MDRSKWRSEGVKELTRVGPKFNEKGFSQFNMQMKVTDFHWVKMKINILFVTPGEIIRGQRFCTVPWLGHGPKHRLSNHFIKPLLGNTQGIQGPDGKCSSCRMSSVLQNLLSTGHKQNSSPGRIPGGILTKWPNQCSSFLSSSPYLYASAQPPSGGNLFQLLVFMYSSTLFNATQRAEKFHYFKYRLLKVFR